LGRRLDGGVYHFGLFGGLVPPSKALACGPQAVAARERVFDRFIAAFKTQESWEGACGHELIERESVGDDSGVTSA
jgi:hypothetical protein